MANYEYIINQHPGLVIQSSSIAGQGVFATQYIPSGAKIEVCPVRYVPELLEPDSPDGQEFLGRTYNFGYERVIAGGYGAYYNHSENPNAEYSTDFERRLIIVRAILNIHPISEVTIRYSVNPADPFVGISATNFIK